MDQTQMQPRRRWTPYRIATTTILCLALLFLLYSTRDQGKVCTSDNECHFGQHCGNLAEDAGIVGPSPFEKACESIVRKWIVF